MINFESSCACGFVANRFALDSQPPQAQPLQEIFFNINFVFVYKLCKSKWLLLQMKHPYSCISPSAYFPYMSNSRNKNRFPRRIRIVPMKLKRMGIQGHKIEPLIMKQLLKDRVFLNDR